MTCTLVRPGRAQVANSGAQSHQRISRHNFQIPGSALRAAPE